MTHLLVDTESGLKIVKATKRNFFHSAYAVQFIGTMEECQKELSRLRYKFV